MNTQTTLKALYDFTRANYDSLKGDYNKLPQKEKSQLPLTLFIIGIFANLCSDVEAKQTPMEADKDSQG